VSAGIVLLVLDLYIPLLEGVHAVLLDEIEVLGAGFPEKGLTDLTAALIEEHGRK